VRRPLSDYLAVVGTLTEWTGGCSSGGKKNDKITKMFTPSVSIRHIYMLGPEKRANAGTMGIILLYFHVWINI